MSAALADTGPLYPLAVPPDEHHERGRREALRFRREGVDVVVTYPVMLETYALLLRRVPLSGARAWLDEVTLASTLLNPADYDYLDAVEIVRRFADQPLTMVDATVATLSERLALPVWTFDHHFDVMRVRRWRH